MHRFADFLSDGRMAMVLLGRTALLALACTTVNAQAGDISGGVTRSDNGQPVSDGAVRIYNSGGTYLGLAFLDNSGHYTYGGLAAGNYFAVTYATGYFDELWDNKPCAQGACTVTTGTPIAVGTGTTTANFALATGGSISGSVTASVGGQPITDGAVRIYAGNGTYLGLAFLDSAGHYTYGGLAAGNYFAVTYDTGYLDELWDNKPCAQGACTISTGTPIAVAASSATLANFQLSGSVDLIFRSGFEIPIPRQLSADGFDPDHADNPCAWPAQSNSHQRACPRSR